MALSNNPHVVRRSNYYRMKPDRTWELIHRVLVAQLDDSITAWTGPAFGHPKYRATGRWKKLM